MGSEGTRVDLFVTCLVDLWRPAVGFAALALLEHSGCRVHVPAGQSCCGQPAWNAGDAGTARALARKTIGELEGDHPVVVPSGSCAGMLTRHYPALLADDPEWGPRARALAARVWELSSFLHARGAAPPGALRQHTPVCYHDSCAGLRELGVREQPRALLRGVGGLELREMQDTAVCCGFGGTFCVKYPEISGRLADDKLRAAEATGAAVLLGGDLGCLLHLAGRARRLGLSLRCHHTAEALAGQLHHPAIGQRTDEPA